jgi:hypothetical protein
MRAFKLCAGLFLAASVIGAGCNNSPPPAQPTTAASGATSGTNGSPAGMPSTVPTVAADTLPTTVAVSGPNAVVPSVSVPATTAPTTPETAPTTAPVVAAPAVPAFPATHVVTKDQPYFKSVPASPTAAPDGTFKAGTKVLVFSFSGSYAKVNAEDGTTAYTATEGIDPISTKK